MRRFYPVGFAVSYLRGEQSVFDSTSQWLYPVSQFA